jgi:hypothetical protein
MTARGEVLKSARIPSRTERDAATAYLATSS